VETITEAIDRIVTGHMAVFEQIFAMTEHSRQQHAVA
jgi:hypothetical protein